MTDTSGRRARTDLADEDAASMGGCAVRLMWLVAGIGALLVTAAFIHRDGHALASPMSLGYWLLVGGTIAARWVDVTRYDGKTADGEPATMSHVRGYSARLLVFAGALWAAAHVL